MLVNNLNPQENGDIIETLFLFVFHKLEFLTSAYVWFHSQAQHCISIHRAIVCINCINPELIQPTFIIFLFFQKVTKMSRCDHYGIYLS